MYDLSSSYAAAPTFLDVEKTVAMLMARSPKPAVPRAELIAVVEAFNQYGQVFDLPAVLAFGQSCHETNGLAFTGDVAPAQHNYGGIGTTGGGVAGASWPTVADGVIGFYCHLATYVFGSVEHWPAAAQHYRTDYYNPRYEAVTGNDWLSGQVHVVGDFVNGRWAWSRGIPQGSLDNGYAAGIVGWSNALPEGTVVVPPEPVPPSAAVRVVYAAGHHNTAGGNAAEIQAMGPLTGEMYRQFLPYAGFTQVVMTPDGPDADGDPGDGTYAGSYNDIARAVVALDQSGQTVEYFWENHNEGAEASARGLFVIAPWWDSANDHDYDVRDRLGPLIGRHVSAATGLPLRTTGTYAPGIMLETETGVGGQGYRLGMFANSASIKDHCTRFIIEFGNRQSSLDAALMHQPTFNAQAAHAVVAALAEYAGVPLGEVPAPAPVERRTFAEVPFYLVWGFKGYWELLEQKGVVWQVLGYPRSNEWQADLSSGLATVQLFDYGALVWHPEHAGTAWECTLALRSVLAELEALADMQGVAHQDV